MSAWIIVAVGGVVICCDAFEGVDDAGEVVVDAVVVGGEALVAFGFCCGDEHGGGLGVASVDVEELDGGLEVGTGEAGVGVGAVLLGWSAAVAVGESGHDPVEVVFDPLGVGGGRRGIEVEDVAGDVDACGLAAVEGFADGGVVELGVDAGHFWAGVAEDALDEVLGDVGVTGEDQYSNRY